MRRLAATLCALTLFFLVSGCAPKPAPGPIGPPPVCQKYPNNPANVAVQMSIQQAFGPYGQAVVDQAGRVACCESGWGPQAVNGQYLGLFQTGSNGYATIRFYSGGAFLPFDPFVNAQTARDFYVTRGRTWSAFSCRP